MTYSLKIFGAALLILGQFVPAFGADNTGIRSRNVYNRKYVYLRDVAKYYGMNLRLLKETCELSSKYSKLRFVYNKREGVINDTGVHFHFAPFLSGWDAFISEKDFLEIVEPALRYNSLKNHRVKVIMIDPGHGGNDAGATGKLFNEKDLVLSMAVRLKQYLNRMGYHVILSRSSDYFLTLAQRCRLCQKNKVDLFISIHCNSAGSTQADGIETYCLTPVGLPSTTENSVSNRKSPGHIYEPNNFKLAYEIQKSVIGKTAATDRGVRHARFYVLKEATCPAVLIETGFLSNPAEERKLGNVSYQDRIVQAIAAAVKKYHRDVVKSSKK